MAANNETPAPTFEELPLEKGAILELHSIGHPDFDGLIVEYMGVDKPTGKFRAMALNESGSVKIDQAMLVKPRACRRPAIKPLRLRKILIDLVETITSFSDLAAHEARLKNILKSDPCCSLALLVLAGSLLTDLGEINGEPDPRQKTLLELALRYNRRAYANVHAYDDIVYAESYFILSDSLLRPLQLLARHKAAVRMLRTILDKYSCLATTQQPLIAKTYCNKGTSSLLKASRYTSEVRFDKKNKALVSAAEDFVLALSICANTEPQSEYAANRKAELVDVYLPNMKYIIQILIHVANNMQHSLGRRNTFYSVRRSNVNVTYEESVIEASKDRIIYSLTQAARLNDKFVDACTLENGTLMFIDDERKMAAALMSERALAIAESLKTDN